MLKKWFLVGFILIAFCGTILAEDYDFRNTRWGMTKEEVKQHESTAPVEEGFVSGTKLLKLNYNANLIGYKCGLVYLFDSNNQLYEADYLFIDFKTNDEWLLAVSKFTDLLTQKYGRPTDKDRSRTSWKTDKTAIVMNHYSLRGNNGGYYYLTIDYKSITKGFQGL